MVLLLIQSVERRPLAFQKLLGVSSGVEKILVIYTPSIHPSIFHQVLVLNPSKRCSNASECRPPRPNSRAVLGVHFGVLAPPQNLELKRTAAGMLPGRSAEP
jgi:hypothetical protein